MALFPHSIDIKSAGVVVFLSSTYFDLKEHRSEIRNTLPSLGWPLVKCMEYELPREGDILTRSLKMVEESYVYIGLIGARYGTRFGGDGSTRAISITEQEFDQATDSQLYRIVLFQGQGDNRRKGRLTWYIPGRWGGVIQSRGEDVGDIKKFKEKVLKDCYVGHFDDKKDAAKQVAMALQQVWDKIDGRMWVEVNRPFDDFSRSSGPLIDLKMGIAEDCGINPREVWPVFPILPVPEKTHYLVLLPKEAINRYLRIPPGARKGGVISAAPFAPDTGRRFANSASDSFSSVSFRRGVKFTMRSHEIISKASPISPLISMLFPPTQAPEPVAEQAAEGSDEENGHKAPSDQEADGEQKGDELEAQAEGSQNGPGTSAKETPMKNVLVSQVTTDGKRPPIIAFFGTKGGVGKTTIVDKFSTLVSRTQIRPNVLMVDFDIHHRGLTVLRTKDRFGNCPTIHEYLANDNLVSTHLRF